MNNSPSFLTDQQTFFNEAIQPGQQLPYVQLGLVNFPSTAQVFHAVFENQFHANCIGNGYGQILEANERICKIFGYTENEMVRLTTKEIFDTRGRNYIAFLNQRESNGKAKAEITGIRKNRERFLCEISSVIFNDDNGEARTLNTLRDISKKYADAAMYEPSPPKDFFGQRREDL